eukprot:CAMPEP_0119070946 /NCGR_PEP_ID=MMETSP1178-20130426/45884_1 /TAXON_ID=33656 /ORGANISM="unid sp, Strain CCMP2000" /LENGTH=139 /DNA_ID=CAMNT_0007052827 /DNA_START=110 /DNA_END=529 /DNA_ORIENTATION=-
MQLNHRASYIHHRHRRLSLPRWSFWGGGQLLLLWLGAPCATELFKQARHLLFSHVTFASELEDAAVSEECEGALHGVLLRDRLPLVRIDRFLLHVRKKSPVSPVKGKARKRLALGEVVLAARGGKAAEGSQFVHLETLR